jgi:hypothetical protein
MRRARLGGYDVPEARVRRVAMNLAIDRARSLRRHPRAILRLGRRPSAAALAERGRFRWPPRRRPGAPGSPHHSPGPDVSTMPDPGPVEQPLGAPPGKVGQQMVRDVATELDRCRGGDPDEKVLVAWGRAHGQTG